VDKAESEPDLARALNATAVGVLARAAAARGAWLVHYSTDYVFDGSGDAPREEDAPTGPLSVYGQTKLEGERLVQDSGCKHLIFRTSWVYAARGGNFARTMLRLAAEREALQVVNDQVGAPTGAELLADVTTQALRQAMARPALAGTYHVVADGHTTWFEYARHVIEWARERGLPVRVAPEAIRGVPTEAYPTPAQRPRNSRLSTRRLRETFGLHPAPWTDGVNRMLEEIRPSLGAK
jgi:dTDP-4-dehydrorhamnose reductase